MDHQIRATAANDSIRAFAIYAKDTVEEARKRHKLSPVVCAALGRVLMGAAMMSRMEKDDRNLLTIQIIGDGPIGGITVTASPSGILKGFSNHPHVEVPPKYAGKLDVGAAVGNGFLRVMRDSGGSEPYIGTVDLVSGEIAEDLTYYFAQSEQTPSAVGLGVLVDTDCTVRTAGGFIIQLMPDTPDEYISILEKNLSGLSPVTELLSDGLSPEDILKAVLDGMDVNIVEKRNVSFNCDCSRDKVIKSLLSLNPADLQEMIDENKPIEVYCDFCGERYTFENSDFTFLKNR